MVDRTTQQTLEDRPLLQPSKDGMSYRALLVGIRTYPNIPGNFGQPLAGCHNDVVAMREILLARGFANEGMDVLLDPVSGCPCPFCSDPGHQTVGVPDRATIVERLERLHQEAASGDVVVFYYSGHGSEFHGRALEIGRRFQTLVPHDSGRGEDENRDITDRFLQSWKHRMVERGVHLTMILDCCHSGGMGDLRSGSETVRKIEPDDRTGQDSYAPALRQELEELKQVSKTDRVAAMLLSGCAAREFSSETDVDGEKRGLFTAHLTRILARPRQAGETWSDLFPEIAAGVTGENLAQHPRREGNGPVFEAGAVDPEDIDPPDLIELAKLAVVIGIDYREDHDDQTSTAAATSFPQLATPERDAAEVARILAEEQGYEIVGLSDRNPGPLLGRKATRRRIHRVIDRLAAIKAKTRRESAVVIYFAGHGLTQVSEDGEQTGYLIPYDADRTDPDSWLPMRDLRDQLVDGIDQPARLEALQQRKSLSRLQARHLLLVLDCCFGGAMAYDFFRGGERRKRPIYYSEYRRFVEGTAWQLLSSASFNQQAMDRDPTGSARFSPFAQAMIEALSQEVADQGEGDHLLTAQELHHYIDRRLKEMGVDIQTPGLADLRPGDGQFLFTVPGYEPTPLPDPPLNPSACPWPGARPYEDAELFYGREAAALELLDCFLACRGGKSVESAGIQTQALAVIGTSGSGVSSLLRAGLLPILLQPVSSRRALRSWARRSGKSELLIEREDLKSLRVWAVELKLELLLADPHEDVEVLLAERIRSWVIQNGWSEEPSASTASSRLVREHLGMPSFAATVDSESWIRRIGLLNLLDRPAELARCLRLWLEASGIADFMTVSDRALPALVGRFRVHSTVEEVLEAWDASLNESMEQKSHPDGELWLCDPLAEEIGRIDEETWERLLEREDLQLVAGLRACDLSRDSRIRKLVLEGSQSWSLHRPSKPSREEVRQAIRGPASERVLYFESAAWLERRVDEAWRSRAPLALVSSALAHMVARAWKRRGELDRQLIPADLAAGEHRHVIQNEPTLVGLVAAEAETFFSSLDPDERRTCRALLLRSIVIESTAADEISILGRPVRWRELELADTSAREQLFSRILPGLIERRILIADQHGVEPVADELFSVWYRASRWIRFLGTTQRRPQELWQRVLSWEASDFDQSQLLGGEGGSSWRASSLNLFERTYVLAGQIYRGLARVERLAGWSAQNLTKRWVRAGLSAVETKREAMRVAVLTAEQRAEWEALRAVVVQSDEDGFSTDGLAENRPLSLDSSQRPSSFFEMIRSALHLLEEAREHCRLLATQTLHNALAATPVSWSLRVPTEIEGELLGLAIVDGSTLLARFSSVCLAWDLENPDASPRTVPTSEGPEAGAGQMELIQPPFVGAVPMFPLVPTSLPVPLGPHAQAGGDGAIRYYPPGRLTPSRLLPPILLLGHEAVPDFLLFSRRRGIKQAPSWLVSAARLSAESSGPVAEIRLWPIDERGWIEEEPRSLGSEEPPEEDFRLTRSDRLPAVLRSGNGEGAWRIEEIARDGSSLRLRPVESSTPELVLAWATGDRSEAKRTSLTLPWPRFSVQSGVREVQLSPDARQLAVIHRGGDLSLWSLPDGKQIVSSSNHIATLTWNRNAEGEDYRLAIGHLDGAVRVFRDGLLTLPSSAEGSSAEDPASSEKDTALSIKDLASSADDTAEDALLLRSPGEGLCVESLRFETGGSGELRLRVFRRRIHEPFDRRVHLYQLDLNVLERLARKRAGRSLSRDDLPRELLLRGEMPPKTPRSSKTENRGKRRNDHECTSCFATRGFSGPRCRCSA